MQIQRLISSQAPWLIPNDDPERIVCSSRIIFPRNILNLAPQYPLSTQNDADELSNAVFNCLKQLEHWNDPLFFKSEIFTDFMPQLLHEKLLYSVNGMNPFMSCAITGDLQQDCLINTLNHLRMQFWFPNTPDIDALMVCVSTMKKLDSMLDFDIQDDGKYTAFSSQTSSLQSYNIESILHLPAFEHREYTRFLQNRAEILGFKLIPLFNLPNIGAFYRLHAMPSKDTYVGSALEATQYIINVLTNIELNARKCIRKYNQTDIINRCTAAFNRIKFGNKPITFANALHVLSRLWLGKALGLFPGIDMKRLQSLITAIQPFSINANVNAHSSVNSDMARISLINSALILPNDN